ASARARARAGKSMSKLHWRVRCPWHEEQTPSCNVSLDDLTFFCFGCQKQGAFVEFVRKMVADRRGGEFAALLEREARAINIIDECPPDDIKRLSELVSHLA